MQITDRQLQLRTLQLSATPPTSHIGHTHPWFVVMGIGVNLDTSLGVSGLVLYTSFPAQGGPVIYNTHIQILLRCAWPSLSHTCIHKYIHTYIPIVSKAQGCLTIEEGGRKLGRMDRREREREKKDRDREREREGGEERGRDRGKEK